MEEEFYHKDIFGTTINKGFLDSGEEKAPIEKNEKFFTGFGFTDALSLRNKKEAWIEYHREIASGLKPEQIFWSITKHFRNLILAKRTKNAIEADLNPFVFKKLKEGVKNFKEGELESISSDLVCGYHDARRGKIEIPILIEKIILSL
jgi:DNA polymerase III delta subunit